MESLVPGPQLLLLTIVLLPPACGFLFSLIKTVSQAVTNLYKLPARSHIGFLPNSPFLSDGDDPSGCGSVGPGFPGRAALFYYENLSTVRYKKGEEEDGARCSFCLCEVEEEEEIRELKCRHVFHKECLDGWILRRRSCPVCRRSLLW